MEGQTTFLHGVLEDVPTVQYDVYDYDTQRTLLQDNIKQALQKRFPLSNERYTLKLSDVDYDLKDDVSLKAQKEAILTGGTITRRLRGKWELTDNATGDTVSKTNRRVIMRVPYMTDRGTFVRNGHEMVVGNILRLQPGVYTRQKANEKFEAHINVQQGTGDIFKVFMDPATGVFNMHRRGRGMRLYPLLRAYGITDDELGESWGKELVDANRAASTGALVARSHTTTFVKKAQETLKPPDALEIEDEDEEPKEFVSLTPEQAEVMKTDFGKMRLDPEATSMTLGSPYTTVDGQMLKTTATKLLHLSQGKTRPDNRDSLEFQRIYGAPELFADRVIRDGGRVSRNLLWKATNKGNLDFIGTAVLDPHINGVFTESRLAQYVEGSSPMDIADGVSRVTRIGEGGISSLDATPIESRLVQHSFYGFIDPVRGPESARIGIDTYLAYGVRKGSDGQLYNKFINAKTRQPEWVSARRAAKMNVTTPEQLVSEDKYVPALDPEGVRFVKKDDVDLVVPHPDRMFGMHSNLVPMKSSLKSMRLLMSSKYASQSVPLVNREVPLVQNAGEDGPVDGSIGKLLGVRYAPAGGVVKTIKRDHLILTTDKGDEEVELYDDFPVNQKGYLRNIPQVKVGDTVSQGDVLASTNYTDDKGVGAMGLNLRVGYISWRGQNFEDGIVVSDSAAKRLTSEHMYNTHVAREKTVNMDKNRYMAAFPGKYDRVQLTKIGDDGLPKAGTVLNSGDPMLLAVRENAPAPGSMGRSTLSNLAQSWEHDTPGVVVGSAKGKNGYTVFVRTNSPLRDGDKLAGRSGNKGVVTVLPDSQMPIAADGRPLEILMSPLGLITRTNPVQVIEAQLGKIAAKQGKPIITQSFTGSNMIKMTEDLLAKNGLSDVEEITDPADGKKIPEVMTGVAYFYKLKHTAEAKESGRGSGQQYTLEDLPGSGGYSGAKRLGNLEMSALMGHGVMNFVKDAKLIRGQANDDFWRDFRMGRTPVMPGEPLVHQKFYAHLRGSGINVRKSKDRIEIFGATDKDMRDLGGNREVKSTDTFNSKTFEPLDSGLFGKDVFGPEGNQWGYIQLDESIPNPVMEDPMRRALKMKVKEFQEAVTEGGDKLLEKLKKIDMKAELRSELDSIRTGKGQKRDDAIKRYRALASMDQQGIHPSDFMMTRIPVLPPIFRPVTTSGSMTMIPDSNYLYKRLMDTKSDLRAAREALPEPEVKEARGKIYDSFKQLAGLDDPDDKKLVQKNVGGLLQWVFGKGSPKFGAFQRKIASSAVDVVGRGTVTPNPSLKLNQIGLPEEQAWSVYEPFVVRQLVTGGYPTTEAIKMVAERHPTAYEALHKAVESRPVVMTRAPALHKFSIMGFWPVLTKGSTIQVSPSIVEPFNMDFDGDNANFHVPVSQAAVKDIIDRMMPEKNLLNVTKFRPHYLPIREYQQGLYLATRMSKGEPVRFKTTTEAKQAMRDGKIAVDTPVKIG